MSLDGKKEQQSYLGDLASSLNNQQIPRDIDQSQETNWRRQTGDYAYRTHAKDISEEAVTQIQNILNALHQLTTGKQGNTLDVLMQTFLGTRPFRKGKGHSIASNFGYALGDHPILDPVKAGINTATQAARYAQMPARLSILRDLVVPGNPEKRRKAAGRLFNDVIGHIPDENTRRVVGHLSNRFVDALDAVDADDPQYAENVARRFGQSIVKDGVDHLLDRFGDHMTPEEKTLISHLTQNPKADSPETQRIVTEAALSRSGEAAREVLSRIPSIPQAAKIGGRLHEAHEIYKETKQTYDLLEHAVRDATEVNDATDPLDAIERADRTLSVIQDHPRLQGQDKILRSVVEARSRLEVMRKEIVDRRQKKQSDLPWRDRFQQHFKQLQTSYREPLEHRGKQYLKRKIDDEVKRVFPSSADTISQEAAEVTDLLYKHHAGTLRPEDLEDYLERKYTKYGTQLPKELREAIHAARQTYKHGPEHVALTYATEALKRRFPNDPIVQEEVDRLVRSYQSETPEKFYEHVRDLTHKYEASHPVVHLAHLVNQFDTEYTKDRYMRQHPEADQASLQLARQIHEARVSGRINRRAAYAQAADHASRAGSDEVTKHLREFERIDNGDNLVIQSIHEIAHSNDDLAKAMHTINNARMEARDDPNFYRTAAGRQAQAAIDRIPERFRDHAETLLQTFVEHQSDPKDAHTILRHLATEYGLHHSGLDPDDKDRIRRLVNGSASLQDVHESLDKHALPHLEDELGLARGTLKAEHLHKLGVQMQEHAEAGTLLQHLHDQYGPAASDHLEEFLRRKDVPEGVKHLLRARQTAKDQLHQLVERHGEFAPTETRQALHQSIDDEDLTALQEHAEASRDQLLERARSKLAGTTGFDFDPAEGVKGKHVLRALEHADLATLARSHPFASSIYEGLKDHYRNHAETPVEQIPTFEPEELSSHLKHGIIPTLKQIALSHVPSEVRGHVGRGLDATLTGRLGDATQHYGDAAIHYLPEGSSKNFARVVLPFAAQEVREAQAGNTPRERLEKQKQNLIDFRKKQEKLLAESIQKQKQEALGGFKEGLSNGVKGFAKHAAPPEPTKPSIPKPWGANSQSEHAARQAWDTAHHESFDDPSFQHRDEGVRYDARESSSDESPVMGNRRIFRGGEDEDNLRRRPARHGVSMQTGDILGPLRLKEGLSNRLSMLKPVQQQSNTSQPFKQGGASASEARAPTQRQQDAQGKHGERAAVIGRGGDDARPQSQDGKGIEDSVARDSAEAARQKKSTIANDTTTLAQGTESTAQGAAQENPVAAISGLAAVGASIYGLINASTGEDRTILPFVPDVNDAPYGAPQTIDAPSPNLNSNAAGVTPVVAASQAYFG